MRRKDPLCHLRAQGCELLREGGRHSIYWNPATRMTSAVPRHSEIVEPVAIRICKDLGIPRPGAGQHPHAATADHWTSETLPFMKMIFMSL